jgi:hypothetical protein
LRGASWEVGGWTFSPRGSQSCGARHGISFHVSCGISLLRNCYHRSVVYLLRWFLFITGLFFFHNSRVLFH